MEPRGLLGMELNWGVGFQRPDWPRDFELDLDVMGTRELASQELPTFKREAFSRHPQGSFSRVQLGLRERATHILA